MRSLVLLQVFILYFSHTILPIHGLVKSCPSLASRSATARFSRNKSSPDEDVDASVPHIDDSLRPPPINLRKESILFDDSSATVANNNVLRIWQFLRRRLPLVVTGTRSDDHEPWAKIYNVVFVRLPTLVAGAIYGKNLVEGRPLVVDLGDGPFEVNPLVVCGVLGAVLRVPSQNKKSFSD